MPIFKLSLLLTTIFLICEFFFPIGVFLLLSMSGMLLTVLFHFATCGKTVLWLGIIGSVSIYLGITFLLLNLIEGRNCQKNSNLRIGEHYIGKEVKLLQSNYLIKDRYRVRLCGSYWYIFVPMASIGETAIITMYENSVFYGVAVKNRLEDGSDNDLI